MGTAVLVGRRSFGARKLLVWLSLVVAVGVGREQVGVRGGAGGLPPAAHGGAAARQGLSGLPLAAQGPVSGILGAGDRSYRVRGGPAGLTALNVAQGLRVGFGRAGVTVHSGSSRLSLGLAAVGYGGRLRPVGRVAPSYRGNRVWYGRGLVSEWYVNGPMGLEHGFTVPHRLPGGGGSLTVSLTTGGLRPVMKRGSVVFEGARGAVVLRYGGLVATDV